MDDKNKRKPRKPKESKEKTGNPGDSAPLNPAKSAEAAETTAAAATNPALQRLLTRPMVEVLPCELSEKELVSRAVEQARLHGDIAKLEAEMKETAGSFKAKITALKNRISEINRKIESRREERQVYCLMRFDFDAGTKTLVRQDTKDEVKTWPLEEHERQMRFPGMAKKDTLLPTASDKIETMTDLAHAPAAAAADAGVVPGSSRGTEDLHTPGAETVEEQKTRVWWNGLDNIHRKRELGIDSESEGVVSLLALPYRRMTEGDREIVRALYRMKLQGAEANANDIKIVADKVREVKSSVADQTEQPQAEPEAKQEDPAAGGESAEAAGA